MARPTDCDRLQPYTTPDVRTVTQTMALSVYCIAALSLTTPRPLEHLISRRGLLGAAAATAALGVPPSIAARAAAARVASWPGIEYLEPIFELKLSLDALAAIAPEPSRWPALKKRLDAFFGGGPLSERNYFAGLSVQYTNAIKYDDLDFAVKVDKQERQAAIENTLNGMDALKQALAESAPDAERVVASAKVAKESMQCWLSLVPASDVREAERLFVATRKADADRNGKLSTSELATLEPADAARWRARVALVGD